MEKVIRAVTSLKQNENRIVTQILKAMINAQVPGFCTEVLDACDKLGTSLHALLKVKDVRKFLTCGVIAVRSVVKKDAVIV